MTARRCGGASAARVAAEAERGVEERPTRSGATLSAVSLSLAPGQHGEHGSRKRSAHRQPPANKSRGPAAPSKHSHRVLQTPPHTSVQCFIHTRPFQSLILSRTCKFGGFWGSSQLRWLPPLSYRGTLSDAPLSQSHSSFQPKHFTQLKSGSRKIETSGRVWFKNGQVTNSTLIVYTYYIHKHIQCVHTYIYVYWYIGGGCKIQESFLTCSHSCAT